MEGKRYQVILTGELMPGIARETAVAMMAEMFAASPHDIGAVFDEHNQPVQGEFSAEDALDLQNRLERIGVRARIERVPTQRVELQLRPDDRSRAGHAGQIRCPACGHEQSASERCVSCGILFRHYRRPEPGRDAAGATVPPQPPTRPAAGPATSAPPGNAQAPQDWRDAWVDFEDDKEPDEEADLKLFFGPNGQAFVAVADKIIDGRRNRFVMGWVWGAMLSPFLWTLYRKMWGWAAVILFTEILIPLGLITVGTDADGEPSKWAYLGYLGLVANRLFWPAVLHYLYTLHARATVMTLHRMSQSRATDIGIARTGGVSATSAVVGLCIASVLGLLVWSVVDSIRREKIAGVEQRIFAAAEKADIGRATNPGGVTGLAEATADTENRWVITRKKLRTIGQEVNGWLARRAGEAEVGQLTLLDLRREMSMAPQAVQDGWGNDVQFIPDNEGYRIISAGPDLLFGTADDIQYRRILAR